MEKWRGIAATLRGEIMNGDPLPGHRLPVETALAERFGVNRHTVRRAVAALAEDGLVQAKQGRGTFVRKYAQDDLAERHTERVGRVSGSQGRRIVAAEGANAGREVAANLGLPLDAPVVHLRTILQVNERPLSLSSYYFCQTRFPEIARLAEDISSVTAILRRCGVSETHRKSTRISTRLPTQREAEHLKIAANRPVLVSEVLEVGADGRAVFCGATVWAGDRAQLMFET